MNILDENILANQRQLLSAWRVPFRQVGYEVGHKGMEDEEIIPLLMSLSHAGLAICVPHANRETSVAWLD